MRFSPIKILQGLLCSTPLLVLLLAACGGGGGGDAPSIATYTIGGTITGAASGIGPVLQNNLGDNLFIPTITTSATPFTFTTPIANGLAYSVTQLSRARSPTQTCAASGVTGVGTVSGANITSVIITCSVATAVPKFAYVTNSTANSAVGAVDTVSGYAINSGTGALTSVGTDVATGDGPYSVVVDPSGQFAYVANLSSNNISAYGINTTTGVLTPIDTNGAVTGTQYTIAAGTSPVSVTVHPSGKFAYVANQSSNSISAYSINSSGALTAIDADGAATGTQASIATGTKPYAITIDPFGKFAYVTNDSTGNVSAYTINQTSGALTSVAGSPFTAGTNPRSVVVDPTGKFAYVANAGGDISAYSIDDVSVPGKLTQINCTSNGISSCSGNNYTAGSAPRSIAIDPATGLYAYVANAGGGVSAFAINSTTGELSAIDADAVTVGNDLTIAAGTAPISINVDPSGLFVYVANFGSDDVSVYNINGAGALTLVETEPAGSGPTSVTTTQ